MASVLLTVLAFLLMLSVLVVIHEAGHAVAARLCGARVTEFFIGMPWGPEVAHTSKRTGIRYGATLALVGGYTRIAGMADCQDPRLPMVLALVNARGKVTPEELVVVLGEDPEDANSLGQAYALLEPLADWGAVARVWPSGRKGRSVLPVAYTTVQRDANGLTVLDRGHDFAAGPCTQEGEPYDPGMSPDDFLDAEKRRTYLGLSLPRRLAVLVAGVACNLAFALVAFTLFFTLHGVADGASLEVDAVTTGGPAAEAGVREGDVIVSVDGAPVSNDEEFTQALADVRDRGGSFELGVVRDGEQVALAMALNDEGKMGIYLGYAYRTLGLGEAVSASASYIGQVAAQVVRLLVPSEAGEVLEQSSGVVGVAVLTSQAVVGGPWSLLLLAGMLSISLGWMNLLPIPPLDGGKVVIELVGAVRRKPVSEAVQTALSLVGVGLFVLLFLYMLVLDVSRLIVM